MYQDVSKIGASNYPIQDLLEYIISSETRLNTQVG